MAMADVAELIATHEDDLPSECFLRDLADKEPDADGNVALGPDVEWCGVRSDKSFANVLPKVAAKIRGTLEAIVLWDGYDPSGLRIVDGVMTEPKVKLVLEAS